MIAGISLCSLSGYHIFSRWGEPERLEGVGLAQRRNCTQCNEVEYRAVMVSVPREEP